MQKRVYPRWMGSVAVLGLVFGLMTSAGAESLPSGMSMTKPAMSDAVMVETVLHNAETPAQFKKVTLPLEQKKTVAVNAVAVARVVWVKGELLATLKNGETNKERSLEKSSLVYLHDTLQTGVSSQAQIVFSDNTLMTFKPATKFYVAQYAYDPASKQKSVGKYVMNLIEGGFRTITGLIAKANPSDYEVNTPVATIGVRGTDYTLIIKDKGIYIARTKGEPCVTAGGGKGGKGGGGGAASPAGGSSGGGSAGQGAGGNKTLCLDVNKKYAMVETKGMAPVYIPTPPTFLVEPIPVTTVTVQQVGGVSGPTITTSGSGGGASDFCIR